MEIMYIHNFRPIYIHVSGLIIIGFMQSYMYVRKVGDPSPESQRILIPSCITIKTIYEEYAKVECKPVKQAFLSNMEETLSKCNYIKGK